MNTIIFPAVGKTQVACGQRNGIWSVWYIHDGAEGKVWKHSGMSEALKMYDDHRDVLQIQIRRNAA